MRICDLQVSQSFKDVGSHDLLADLLELIESILRHLDIYTRSPVMTENVVKTLGELLFVLAMATKLIKKGQPGESVLTDALPDSM